MRAYNTLVFSTIVVSIVSFTSTLWAEDSALATAKMKASAGQAAFAESQSLATNGEQEPAQAKYDEAKALMNEAVLLCQAYIPEKLTIVESTLYAQAMSTAGEYDLAARAYERSFALDPNSIESALSAGRNWGKVGEAYHQRALSLLHTVLTHEPANATLKSAAHTELGHIYFTQKLFVLAGDAYNEANTLASAEADTQALEAQLGLALIQIQQGYVAEASKILESITNLTSEQGRFLQEGLTTSLQVMNTNRATIAETAEAHHAYAKLLLRAQRVYESLLAVEHAVLLDDSDYSMHNLRGGLLIQQGQMARATASYTRSLELNPNQPRTREMLTRLQAQP